MKVRVCIKISCGNGKLSFRQSVVLGAFFLILVIVIHIAAGHRV